MAKLGHFLVERGLITSRQLMRALESQRLIGGRLGTALLEISAIPEPDLLKALAEQAELPAARPKDLRDIRPEVTALLPAKAAVRFHAVPFRLLGGELWVAVQETTDLEIEDQLAFITGKKIKPHIALEIRIDEALERYYETPCRLRVARLLERLNHKASKQEGTAATKASAAQKGQRSMSGDGRDESPTLITPRVRRSQSGVLAQPASRVAPATVTPIAKTVSETPPPPSIDSLVALEKTLANPVSADQVGRSVVTFLKPEFERLVLLRTRRGTIEGWMGSGPGLDEEGRLKDFTLAADAPSIFLSLQQGTPFHVGPLLPLAAHRELSAATGLDLYREILVVPVRLKKRLVSVLLAQTGGRSIKGDEVEMVKRVASKMAIAFELCIMRDRLRQA
ncbi:MAG TPA: hypothetical protein VKA53_02805 [Thermoanaerobaculia bacterium]|nr:hypothetical protein [Thermoanaerobaculia bacterium]